MLLLFVQVGVMCTEVAVHLSKYVHSCVKVLTVLLATDILPNITLRLVGGKNSSEGRVEMLYNEEWGTICDDDWANSAAQVVCRQLGYLRVERSTLEFGPGNGTIWLDNVGCTGNESSLLECNHGGLGEHNCAHSEDIGVVCSSELRHGSKYTVYLHYAPR